MERPRTQPDIRLLARMFAKRLRTTGVSSSDDSLSGPLKPGIGSVQRDPGWSGSALRKLSSNDCSRLGAGDDDDAVQGVRRIRLKNSANGYDISRLDRHFERDHGCDAAAESGR